MATSPKPLTPRMLAFAERYAGPKTGVETARDVGYRGSPQVLSSRVAKLLADPRVQAILRERRAQGGYSGPIGAERHYEAPADAVVPDAPPTVVITAETSEDFARAVMNAPSVPWTVRASAAKELRQIEKERRREDTEAGVDVLRRARALMLEILANASLSRSLRRLAKRHPAHAAELVSLADEVEVKEEA